MNKGKPRVKRKMLFVSQYEVGAIEKFLEEQAASGWMFRRISGIFYVFEECEPKKVKFQVDYFDQATMFDSYPEYKTLDYIEYCRESGWHHLYGSGKMQIFYSLDEDVVPIQTDEKEKLHLIGKSTILMNWMSWIFVPIFSALAMAWPIFSHTTNPKNYISYADGLTSLNIVIFWLCILLLGVIDMTRFGFFYICNVRRLNNGENIQYFSLTNVKIFWTFKLIYLLFLVAILAKDFVSDYMTFEMFSLLFLEMIGFVLLINKVVHSRWANRERNIAFTVVASIVYCNIFLGSIVFGTFCFTGGKVISGDSINFYATDKIDITLGDLKMKKPDKILYEEKNHDRQESFLAVREEYSNYYCLEEEDYGYSLEIFSSKLDTVMDQYNQLVLKHKGYTFTEWKNPRKEWGTNQVYYGKGTDGSMFVIQEKGRTYLVTGDLNKAQITQLVSYYIKE